MRTVPEAVVHGERVTWLQVYEREAAKCGVSLQSCPHSVREFAISSLPGDYRRLIHRPRDLQCQLLAYSDSNQDLGYTDWDALRGRPRPAADLMDAGQPACFLRSRTRRYA